MSSTVNFKVSLSIYTIVWRHMHQLLLTQTPMQPFQLEHLYIWDIFTMSTFGIPPILILPHVLLSEAPKTALTYLFLPFAHL